MNIHLTGSYFDSTWYMKLYFVDELEQYEDRRVPFELQTFNLTI